MCVRPSCRTTSIWATLPRRRRRRGRAASGASRSTHLITKHGETVTDAMLKQRLTDAIHGLPFAQR